MPASTLTHADGAVAPTPRIDRWARVLPEVRWAALALLLFAVGGLLQVVGAPTTTWWVAYLLCYVAGGWEPGLAGLRALQGKALDVDLLMVVAAVVAAAIGQVFDGALLIVIFATSGALEAVATRRTRDSVTALLDLAPERATRVDDAGRETEVDTATLQVGDMVRIRPGERVGADAIVAEGRSDVDQAAVTGESVPAVKQPSSEVYAGTMNGTGSLLVTVSRRAEESVVARIVAMVEEASQTKARTQLFIDGIEQRYSVGMVGATLLLFFVPLAFGAALDPTLLRAITFMIVASPCGVVLATMPPLLSAIANAGRHGVLVKSAVVMEQLALTDTVAFDKTGTLTRGTPRVTQIDLAAGGEFDATGLLGIAAAAELPSQHPLAAAVVSAARDAGIGRLATADEFTSVPGRGVRADVGGRVVEIGAPFFDEHVGEHRRFGADVHEIVTEHRQRGETAVVVSVDGSAQGVISLADELRAGASAAVGALSGIIAHAPLLLTGDNTLAARLLAAQVGIDDVRAELLPEDKVAAVRELQADGRKVMLVGDGVNDAPAMAAAHLGVSMGRNGSDLALQTADAVIVRDDLTTLAAVISLSRRARRVVLTNLAIAAAVITGLVIWDLTGTLPLPLGVAGHEGSTVLVGLNGLRLLRNAAWTSRGLPDAPDVRELHNA